MVVVTSRKMLKKWAGFTVPPPYIRGLALIVLAVGSRTLVGGFLRQGRYRKEARNFGLER